MPKSRIFNVANMSVNTIRENKILAKISEFTVAAYQVLSIGLTLSLLAATFVIC